MKVSVIIPCYNAAAFVNRAVASVAAQDYADIELICVNDGSQDETLAVLQALCDTYKSSFPFAVIDQRNSGASTARNHGLEHANGTYIQFLDSDDWLLPGKISTQVRLGEESGLPDFIVGGFARVKESGEIFHERMYSSSDQNRIWSLLLNTNLGNTVSNLFLAASVRKAGGWNVTLRSSQEYDLMFRLLKSGGTVVFDSTVQTYILERESGSISKSNAGKNALRYLDLRLRIREYLVELKDIKGIATANESIFDAIRSVYRYDRKEALRLFSVHLTETFQPPLRNGNGKVYRSMFRLLGFSATERLYSLVKGKA